MAGKARQANFEALRILAMLMVVTMHYLIKGNIAVSMAQDGSLVNLSAWLVEAFCIAAVNVYVLISGYFMVETEWKVSRLLRTVLQVWVYSAAVPVVCLVLGIGDVAQWDIYNWATVIFPFQMEHYWFATAYIVMYLFVPVLSVGVKKMTKRQLEVMILLLLVFFSLGKTVIPIFVPTDRYGYDFGWFICLFLIAAYIRLYGIPFFDKKGKAFAVYFAGVAAIWGVSMLLGMLSRRGLPLSYAMDMTYCYNHILVLVTSIGLFCGFSFIRIPEGFLTRMICKIAPYTFGVYLLHENIAIRLLWQGWFKVETVRGSFAFFPHMLLTVLVVFLAGIMVDFVREYFFDMIGKCWKHRNTAKNESL